MIANEETFRRLMTKAQAGDKLCYSSLLTECEKWLRRYYARKINPAAIDDLVQETLISLHRKRASYDPARPFLPWLAAIGRYRWIDSLRKIYRHEHDQLYEDMVADPQDETVTAKVSLERLLDRIPPKQAEVISLVKIEGLSIIEASAKTGQSESLVKVNIHRGLKKLSAMVETE
ncbi:sigma-70 family RNA polymerase sigma factor [Sphingorhabdus sp. YGSMI21]|uniref:sigma-70 family RNA polymerase sigma factor n=1 Tax=Sphingorhabdus sp. YGSMI21 TaxID=2077182 RepID=UPI000C1E4956|nr:sigma-70 family RNA polymerase sigma factor [Sphingorhabdus sp. YGSMI21]ATW02886.1 RNA polymerase subunit sigma-24 [Sphingorhabdus sp. YGSMI21]